MKDQTDKHLRDVKYKVGDYEYVKMQLRRQLSLIRKDNQKFAYKFYGLYQIEKRIEAVAYCLKLLKEAQVHPIFHVSQLKPASGPPKNPRRANHLKMYYELHNIYKPKGLRRVCHGPDGSKVFIKWTKMSVHGATWEIN